MTQSTSKIQRIATITHPTMSHFPVAFTTPWLDALIAAEATRRSNQCTTCTCKSYTSIHAFLTHHNIPFVEEHPTFSLVSKRSPTTGEQLGRQPMDIAYHPPSSVPIQFDLSTILSMKQAACGPDYTSMWNSHPQSLYALEGIYSHRDQVNNRPLQAFTQFHFKRYLAYTRQPCTCPDLVVVFRKMAEVSDPRAKMVAWAMYHVFAHIFPVYDADEIMSGDANVWMWLFTGRHEEFRVGDFKRLFALGVGEDVGLIPGLMVELMLDVLEDQQGLVTRQTESAVIRSEQINVEVRELCRTVLEVEGAF